MDYKNLFEKFNGGGKLLLPDATVAFDAIPWSKHPTSPGAELKHIIVLYSREQRAKRTYWYVHLATAAKEKYPLGYFSYSLRFSSPHCFICSKTGMKLFPKSVRLYST